MTRKRKVNYPPSRSSRGPAPVYTPQVTPPTVAVINKSAGVGKAGIVPGVRVIIQGSGLYSGETAVVESLMGGVIPAAIVRTEAGQTRRIRTVDLALAPTNARPAEEPAPTEAPEG